MDETNMLEKALQNCQTLERSIYDSIRVVRRLNIRYNSDWLLKNYKNYVTNIWTQYRCRSPEKRVVVAAATTVAATATATASRIILPKLPKISNIPKLKPIPKNPEVQNTIVGARSSQELFGSNRRINYKFIKIKRSMEALILQIQRVIEIANRQKNYVHMNVSGRGSKTHICCH